MSGIRLLTGGVFARGTVVATSGTALASYLNDADAGPQWVADTTAAQTLTIDTGAAPVAPFARTLALVHHNLPVGTAVAVDGSADAATWTPLGTLLVIADPFLADLPAQTQWRYWRVRLPALAAVARLGEILLGIPYMIADNPNLPTGKPAIVGNVARDRSPAGYPWNTQKGLARRRYDYRWAALPDADLAFLEAAYAACANGARPLVLEDQLGTALWVTWEDAQLGAPGALGLHQQEMSAAYEEVPFTVPT
jgi:hypothetical protein